jgi:hypothetical protein
MTETISLVTRVDLRWVICACGLPRALFAKRRIIDQVVDANKVSL